MVVGVAPLNPPFPRQQTVRHSRRLCRTGCLRDTVESDRNTHPIGRGRTLCHCDASSMLSPVEQPSLSSVATVYSARSTLAMCPRVHSVREYGYTRGDHPDCGSAPLPPKGQRTAIRIPRSRSIVVETGRRSAPADRIGVDVAARRADRPLGQVLRAIGPGMPVSAPARRFFGARKPAARASVSVEKRASGIVAPYELAVGVR